MPTFKQDQSQKQASSRPARSNQVTAGANHHPSPMLHLQRAIGNQAGLRSLQAPAHAELQPGRMVSAPGDVREQEADQVTHTGGVVLQRTCACGGTSGEDDECAECRAKRLQGQGVLQAKLTVGAANDAYEQEADRVAEQVMRMPEPLSESQALSITPVTSRQAQSKESGAEAPATAPPIVHEALSSPGQPLDAATRGYFEPRFGHDLTRVRLHTDPKAAESARAVNALAYTIGNDIVLGTGQYRPRTIDGSRLLAHELTHVVQQAQAPQLARRVQRQTPAEAALGHSSVTPGEHGASGQGLSQLDREHPEFSRQLTDFSQRFWDLFELTQGPLILSGIIDASHHIQALTQFNYYLGMLRRQEQYMNQGDRYSPRDIHNWLELVEGALGAVGPLMDLAAPGVSDDLQETEAIREIRSRLPELGAELTELQGESFIRAESEKIEAQKQAGRDEAAAEAARRETPEGRRDAAIEFTREYVKDEHKWWPNQDHPAAGVFAEQLGYYYIHEEKLSGADIKIVLKTLASEDDLLDRALYQGLLLEYLLLEGVTDLGIAELPRATGGDFYNGFNLTWLDLLQRDPITTPDFSTPTPLDVFKFELGLHWGVLAGIAKSAYGTVMDVASLFQGKTYTDVFDLLVKNVWDEQWRFGFGKSFALALHAYFQDITDDGPLEIGQKFGEFIGSALWEIILGIITGGILNAITKLLKKTRWGAALVLFAEKVVDAMPWVEPKVVDIDEDLPTPSGHPVATPQSPHVRDELIEPIAGSGHGAPSAPAASTELDLPTPDANKPATPDVDQKGATPDADTPPPLDVDPEGKDLAAPDVDKPATPAAPKDADLEASVKRSSELDSNRLTFHDKLREVAYINTNPSLIKGEAPNRFVKLGKGDHEIVEVPGIGCERRSSKGVKVPCPTGMSEEKPTPANMSEEQLKAMKGIEAEKWEKKSFKRHWKTLVRTDTFFGEWNITFNELTSRLSVLQGKLNGAGKGGLLPKIDDSYLKLSSKTFILEEGTDELQKMYEILEASSSLKVRNEIEKVFGRDFEKWVGDKELDAIEFDLDNGIIDIVDVTLRSDQLLLVHNLKTKFYREVMQKIVGTQGPVVEAFDLTLSLKEMISMQ